MRTPMEATARSRRQFMHRSVSTAAAAVAASALSPQGALLAQATKPAGKALGKPGAPGRPIPAPGKAILTPEQAKMVKARDAFFRTGRMVKLEITLPPENADALRKEPREYVKCSMRDADNVVYPDVGIHLRGSAGSFRPYDEKPGLTINMDKFKDKQLFHGLDKFHLANSVQDPSYLSELFCGEMCRASDVPAARITHAVVILDGKPRGLYVLKEGYDKTFLRTGFGHNTGNFYDGGFLSDIDKPLELLDSKDDVAERADLAALVAACGVADPKARWAALQRLLDMERFLTFMALEVIAWHWDGYTLKGNNYRVFHDALRDKITFIPSGMDQMFSDPNGPLFPAFASMVARAVTETPEGKRAYVARVAKLLRDVFNNPAAMAKWLTFLQARVQPAVDYVDKAAGRDFPSHVNRLREAVTQRSKSLEEQIRKVRL